MPATGAAFSRPADAPERRRNRVYLTPPFPVVSDKRGVDRAIEIVEWQKSYAQARAAESRTRGSIGLANVWEGNAVAYDATLRLLSDEAGR